MGQKAKVSSQQAREGPPGLPHLKYQCTSHQSHLWIPALASLACATLPHYRGRSNF